MLRKDELLGIYPEGTRSHDGRLYKGKVGVAVMALQGAGAGDPLRDGRHLRDSSRPAEDAPDPAG